MKHRLFLILIATVILGGCIGLFTQEPPIKCDILFVPPLQKHIGQTLEFTEALRILESTYGIQERDAITKQYPDRQAWNVRWTSEGFTFELRGERGYLSQILVYPQRVEFTAEQIFQCIEKSPEWYRALYGPQMERPHLDYLIEMWELSTGTFIGIQGDAKSVDELPTIIPNLPVTALIMVEPGTIESVFGKTAVYYGYSDFSKIPESLRPKPWPGDWQEIEFVQGW